jgi:predicted transcriptional regulator
MKLASTDEQERHMLTNLDHKLLNDYFLLKEKGDDLRVYEEEKEFVPNKAKMLNKQDQLVVSKNFKIPLVSKPKT